MNAATAETIDLVVTDLSGQHHLRASDVPKSATITQMLEDLLARLKIGRHDSNGAPLEYRVRLDREARHLHGDERVGDALRPDDEVTLHPTADAGAAAAEAAG
jgi:hypothetical protein